MQKIKKTESNQALWTELNDDCAEKISGGYNFPDININVNTAIQTNIAVIIGNNPIVNQYNSYGKK